MYRTVQGATSPREAARHSCKRKIGIRNIKVRQRAILQEISVLAANNSRQTALQLQSIDSKLQKTVNRIEKICADTNATPADLTNSSRQIYAWMKFLTYPKKLEIHHETTSRIQKIARIVLRSHEASTGIIHPYCWHRIVVEITNIAGLYRVKHSRDRVVLTVSEGFINAGEDVLMALVSNSLLKRDKSTTRTICDFAYSYDYCQILRELDQIIEVSAESSQGKHYDLDSLFAKINREYFAMNLIKPRLMWSSVATYRKLGHYEPARDRIVMSLALDNASVPDYVVEFVLYHELLHKLHGTKLVNGRRMIHTPEFRRDELKFKRYREAEIWLQTIVTGAFTD